MRGMSGISTKSFELQRAYEETRMAAGGGYDTSGKLADPNALEQFEKEND